MMVFLVVFGIVSWTIIQDTGVKANGDEGVLPDGTYIISSALDLTKVLDIVGGSTENRANVQLYERNGTEAQQIYHKTPWR